MTHSERALAFRCSGSLLQGVLAAPALAARSGVVIVVGGPQYRVGSHRQFVLLARALADAGFATLRFDVRGMGDSEGEPRGFEQLGDDIAAAIDALSEAVPTVRRVVLWGLCDGASAALLYEHERRDPRVKGLCLLNPWVRSENTLARVHVQHYYRKRLMQPEFWKKLIGGGIASDALTGFARNLGRAVAGPRTGAPAASFRDRMAAAWHSFDGAILLLLSGRDLTAREFADHARGDAAWAGALALPKVERHDLADADHTFSSAAARTEVERIVAGWLTRLAGGLAP